MAEATQPETAVLDAAERLFYDRGIRSVGMDDVRAESGVSLKRMYQLYAGKEHLVEAMLDRRDLTWRSRLAAFVASSGEPPVLAVFDWLYVWFQEPDFRGCAWINAFSEMGPSSEVVRRQAREHKARFRDYLAGLVADARLPEQLTEHLLILAEGAMVTAALSGDASAARAARSAAQILAAAGPAAPPPGDAGLTALDDVPPG